MSHFLLLGAEGVGPNSGTLRYIFLHVFKMDINFPKETNCCKGGGK